MHTTSSSYRCETVEEASFLRPGGHGGRYVRGCPFLLLRYLSAAPLGTSSPMEPAKLALRSILNLGPGTMTGTVFQPQQQEQQR